MKYTPESTKLDDPPSDFCEWWNPSTRDNESGADIGGHPDAERVWARKDPGRWVHRTYGINARTAWNTDRYRQEYFRWISIGRPEREDCIMIAESIAKQRAFWTGVKMLLSQIAKPLPIPQPSDHDAPPTHSQPEY